MTVRIMHAAAIGLAGLLVACSPEEAPDASVPTFDAAVFHETTSFGLPPGGGHAFSGGDGRILISSDETGVFNAYAVDPDTEAREQLTASDSDAYFALSWFPEDDRILVTADQGGNELDHIYVRESDGALTDITPGEELKAFFVGWSADGSDIWLATNERDPGTFDLYAVDAGDYSRSLVFRNETGFQFSDISPDGRYLAFVRNRTSADSDIFLLDTQGITGEPDLITAHEGNVAHGVYGFTPDGAALIYSTNAHGEFNQAWRFDLESREHTPLIEADWDVSFVSHSPSGRYRVHGVNADARTQVTILDQESGEPVALPDLPGGELRSVRFSRDESAIAFLINAATSPSNLHVVDLASQDHDQLTNALNPALSEDIMVDAEVVRFASFDGMEIPGVLYRPHGADAEDPVPALVWVHGGPGGQSRVGYSATIQHLVNHGYAVYAVNNRGSSGYGKTFFHLDDRAHGEGDLMDVVSAGNWLRSLDWVREDQVGVIGGSYGGFMVAAALAFHPEEFEVGINIFGVTNWVRTLQSIPPWWESFREALYDEMGDPATDAERHEAISPLFHAANIVRPLLVVQGANDPRVLQVESDELVASRARQ
jgi:dipeptidyl aminopeptidase/acylaminoacyl peptidase